MEESWHWILRWQIVVNYRYQLMENHRAQYHCIWTSHVVGCTSVKTADSVEYSCSTTSPASRPCSETSVIVLSRSTMHIHHTELAQRNGKPVADSSKSWFMLHLSWRCVGCESSLMMSRTKHADFSTFTAKLATFSFLAQTVSVPRWFCRDLNLQKIAQWYQCTTIYPTAKLPNWTVRPMLERRSTCSIVDVIDMRNTTS